jgi:hypothetical protein
MDPNAPSLEEKIRMNADLIGEHLSQHAGFELGYDARSIEWLDGFIERRRERDDFDPAADAPISNKIGCFLGEALCEQLGGRWDNTEYGLGVIFPDGNVAYPLAKAEKHFANGSDDSINSFFQTALVLFRSPEE